MTAGVRHWSRAAATVLDADGKATDLGRRPKEWVAPEVPEGVVSVTDPDTQRMKANHGYVQGYNAQAVVDEGQIVIAADGTLCGYAGGLSRKRWLLAHEGVAIA